MRTLEMLHAQAQQAGTAAETNPDARQGLLDALGSLRAQQQGKLAGSTFETDATAPPESYAGRLHQARIDFEALHSSTNSSKPRVAFESAGELVSLPEEPIVWNVEKLMTEKSLVALAAEPKVGKTWMECELLMAIATGTPAFGKFKVGTRGRVALFAAEDDKQSLRRRLRALANGRGMDPAQACADIHLRCRGHLNLLDDADLCSLVAAARMLGPIQAIALDPLRDLHTGEENAADGMAEVMGRLRAVRDLLGCSVLFVHHMSKANKEQDRRPGQRMRGSSALHGAIDAGIYLQLDGEPAPASWTLTAVSEVKAGPGAGTFTLRLDVEDNDSGGAVCARWTVSEKPKQTPEEKKEAKQEKIVERVLEVLRAEWQENPTGPKPLSADALRDRLKAYKNGVDTAIALAVAQGRAKRAMRGLKPLGLVYVPAQGEQP